jgi:hypothetical protein
MGTGCLTLIGIGIFIGCIAAFGPWGILVFIVSYYVLGFLARKR